MKYSFPDVPAHLVSVSQDIPAQYKNYQYPFAKCLLSSSPAAVILEQKTPVRNCVMSHHWIFVKSPLKLQLKANEPGGTLLCMMQGSVDYRPLKARQMRLYQGQYNVLQLQQDTHEIHLNPGLYASWGIDGLDLFPPLSGIIWNKLYQLIHEVTHIIPGKKTTEMQLYSKLLEIQAMVLEDQDQEESRLTRDANGRLFETVRAYLCNHLDTRPDLAQLARSFCISQSKLKQGFKKYYLTTVWNYHHKQRMERSMQLLLQSNKSVADIAAELGYMPTNFTRDFKKFYGYPPRIHRTSGVSMAGKGFLQ